MPRRAPNTVRQSVAQRCPSVPSLFTSPMADSHTSSAQIYGPPLRTNTSSYKSVCPATFVCFFLACQNTQITLHLRRAILNCDIKKNAQAKATLVEAGEQAHTWYENPQRGLLPRLRNLTQSPMADLPSQVEGAACTHPCTPRQPCAHQRPGCVPPVQEHAVVIRPWIMPWPRPAAAHAIPNLRRVEAPHGEAHVRVWKLAVNTLDHVLRNVSNSPRDFFDLIGLALSPEEADLSSRLEDAPLTKLFLHAAGGKLWKGALFPEVAANGWHL